jgi:CarD family transcriptional regulator
MDKIKSGSVFEVAEVYRDLSTIKQDKELSFGERKMLDTAHSLLVKEISLAKNMKEEDVERDIKSNLFVQTQQDEG